MAIGAMVAMCGVLHAGGAKVKKVKLIAVSTSLACCEICLRFSFVSWHCNLAVHARTAWSRWKTGPNARVTTSWCFKFPFTVVDEEPEARGDTT